MRKHSPDSDLFWPCWSKDTSADRPPSRDGQVLQDLWSPCYAHAWMGDRDPHPSGLHDWGFPAEGEAQVRVPEQPHGEPGRGPPLAFPCRRSRAWATWLGTLSIWAMGTLSQLGSSGGQGRMHECREALQRGWDLSSMKLTCLFVVETGKRFWGTTSSHYTCLCLDLASQASYLTTKHHLQDRLMSRASMTCASLWLGKSCEPYTYNPLSKNQPKIWPLPNQCQQGRPTIFLFTPNVRWSVDLCIHPIFVGVLLIQHLEKSRQWQHLSLLCSTDSRFFIVCLSKTQM